jgi:sterol desaturase/sphingolipid hydroxylase (fatty acid hydroxylase superfamily)
MKAEDVLGMLVPVTYFTLLGIEAIWPARTFPEIKRWRWLGIAFVVGLMTLGAVTPLLIPVEWLAKYRLLDGTRLGVAGGAVVGFLFAEFVGYFVHRAFHKFSFLWRWGHQLHHSAQRIDVASSAIFHPFEIAFQNVLSIALAVLVLGVEPLSGAIVGFLGAFHGIFQHANIKTPRWIGYLIQRPEAHCIHHELNVHGYNYANFPLIDVLFGTFKNPETFEGPVGFDEPMQLGAMLTGRDVSGGLGGGIDRQRPRLDEAQAA